MVGVRACPHGWLFTPSKSCPLAQIAPALRGKAIRMDMFSGLTHRGVSYERLSKLFLYANVKLKAKFLGILILDYFGWNFLKAMNVGM